MTLIHFPILSEVLFFEFCVDVECDYFLFFVFVFPFFSFFSSKEKEFVKFDPISLSLLKEDKMYLKLLKKQQKEMDALRKKQSRDKSNMMFGQQAAFEKVIKGCKKSVPNTMFKKLRKF